MNNQSNRDQKNFGRQTSDKVSQDQKRSDFQRDQRSSGAQRNNNISPDAKRSAPNDTDLNE